MRPIDPQRQSEQRSLILQAAAHLIATGGYHGMSMRDLARATGRSLASCCNYYSSKEEILFRLQQEAFESLLETVRDDLAQAEGADEALYVFIAHHVRYFVSHPEVMSVLIHEAASLPPEMRRQIRALKEAYFDVGRRVVRDAIAPEEPGEADLDRRTYSLFGMLNWIYGWYRPGEHGSAEELAATIHRIAAGGLGATVEPSRLRHLERRLAEIETRPLIAGAAP